MLMDGCDHSSSFNVVWIIVLTRADGKNVFPGVGSKDIWLK